MQNIPVIGAPVEDAYLYVGFGIDIVLICEHDVPKWRNAVGLSPKDARLLARQLLELADRAEEPRDEEPEGLNIEISPAHLEALVERP